MLIVIQYVSETYIQAVDILFKLLRRLHLGNSIRETKISLTIVQDCEMELNQKQKTQTIHMFSYCKINEYKRHEGTL